MNSMEISHENRSESSGFSNFLKSFDIYRTLPQDMSEPTYSGAFMSFVCAVLMTFFVYFEVTRYCYTNVKSDMFIDVQRGSEKLQVNLDILFPKMPCAMLTVDIQDIVGSHSLDLGGQLYKRSLDKNGNYISDQLHISDHGDHDNENNVNLDEIKQAFINHEGCQIYGYLTVNRVPGNFHISSHALGPLLGLIMAETGISIFDVSHKINHLSFGNSIDIEYVKKNFDKGALSPLDGIDIQQNLDLGYIIQYFLQVVSTIYIDTNGAAKYVCQFAGNYHKAPTNMIPAVYFKYDLSPMTVKYTKEREAFLHFIVQVCAIIGGVFTIAHMVDNLLFKWTKALFTRSEELNK